MSEPEDEPVRQRLRFVTLMHCEPGRAHHPETGQPMVFFTLSHKGEMLQSLAINLRDAARLIEGLCRALATFDDDDAAEIVHKYFGGCDGNESAKGFRASIESSTKPLIGALSPSELPPKRTTSPVIPSRSSASPTTPIDSSEAWILHRLLANVKNHAEFLKFIGAKDVDEPTKSIPPQKPLAGRNNKNTSRRQPERRNPIGKKKPPKK